MPDPTTVSALLATHPVQGTALLLGDRCVYCGEDTSMGSGRFVNRLGTDTDLDNNLVTWLSDQQKAELAAAGILTLDGWGCPECTSVECDRCGQGCGQDYVIVDGDISCEDCLTPDEAKAAGFKDEEDG